MNMRQMKIEEKQKDNKKIVPVLAGLFLNPDFAFHIFFFLNF
jgi:hypothetical protein